MVTLLESNDMISPKSRIVMAAMYYQAFIEGNGDYCLNLDSRPGLMFNKLDADLIQNAIDFGFLVSRGKSNYKLTADGILWCTKNLKFVPTVC